MTSTLRAALLGHALRLVPAVAMAAAQCAIPPAAAAQPALRDVSPEELTAAPVLQHIAASGAKLYDLGELDGLRTVFATSGTAFQVFYITPDGQGAIRGIMQDAAGKNLTRVQVEHVPGVIPTVTVGPEADALQAVASTTYGTLGREGAPRLWVFIDPQCSFSLRGGRRSP